VDTLLLGMGGDGHFASLFPGGDRLAAGLDPAGSALLVPMRAPDAGEPRLGLSLAAIRRARRCMLHIEGETKRRVLERADAGDARLPVHALLQACAAFLPCYWCP
jgi:6-phosphogluconolactonase